MQVVAEDAAGNLDLGDADRSHRSHGPEATLTRASGQAITVRVGDGASGVAGGTIEVRNRPSDPFRALPTTLAERTTDRSPRPWERSRVGIRVSVSDNAGNVTVGPLSEMSLRVGGRSLRGGAASVGYGRSARVTGRLLTRDGEPIAEPPIAMGVHARGAAQRQVVATVTTTSRGASPIARPPA